MKKKSLIKKASVLTMSIVLLTSSVTFAHQGGLDSKGGHRDNKNVSRLGLYHYHCGVNPAHLHPKGVCNYKTPAKPSTNKVYAKVPNFAVRISGVDINNAKAEYPPLILNDITYIPLTWDILDHLDLLYKWDDPTNLIFNRKASSNTNKQFKQLFNNGSSWYGNTVEISKINKGIVANSSTVSSKYPIINYKNINYLPLTWEITQSLGLKGGWTPTTGFDLNLK